MVSCHAVIGILRQKCRESLLGDRQRPIAKGCIDDLPLAAQFAVLCIAISSFASQFVDFERFGKPLGLIRSTVRKQNRAPAPPIALATRIIRTIQAKISRPVM
jgi:hypothetical protein